LRTTVLLGLALGWLLPADGRSGAMHSQINSRANLRITIRVVNSPVVPVKSLAAAEKVAGHIFGQAGVEAIWVDCDAAERVSSPCSQDREQTEFRVQILKSQPPNLQGDATGFAVLTPSWRDGECYAGVSYSMAVGTALSLDVAVSDVLGAALAHEVGHLLLGPNAHVLWGVMCPRLGRQQLKMATRGELLFTPEQAARIRAVARRMGR
jgi:hypothetical protein